MSSIYRDYWATTGDPQRGPRAGFQTLWVQRQLQRLAARAEAEARTYADIMSAQEVTNLVNIQCN